MFQLKSITKVLLVFCEVCDDAMATQAICRNIMFLIAGSLEILLFSFRKKININKIIVMSHPKVTENIVGIPERKSSKQLQRIR